MALFFLWHFIVLPNRVVKKPSVTRNTTIFVIADTDSLLCCLALGSQGVDNFTLIFGDLLANLLWHIDTLLLGYRVALLDILKVAVLLRDLKCKSKKYLSNHYIL